MYDTILVPTDGSDAASAAAEGAIALARRFNAKLHVVHVLNLSDLPDGVNEVAQVSDDLVHHAEKLVATVVDLATNAGLNARAEVVEAHEPVHKVLVDYARDHDVDCIVMGTHGRTGLTQLALGSTAERTLRASSVPVITVHEDGGLDPEFERILVPIDGSDAARAAANLAIDLTAETNAALHIVHVVDIGSIVHEGDSGDILAPSEDAGQQAVDEIVDRAREADIRSVEASVLSGPTHRVIVDYATDRDIDCIVMGTHGRTGVDRLLVGSVTERVIGLTTLPVIGTKGPAADDAVGSE
ncbi:universal stress protein [Natronorarus salvus]|uniref:universal stress protein n=1 Tax=Natronorarus salvus TaxID=3117733 RepID=UPI002F2675F3